MSNVKGAAVSIDQDIGESVLDSSASRGLCHLCTIESTCKYKKRAPTSFFYCNEFTPHQTISSNPIVYRISAEVVDGDRAKFKGLCVNCDNRQACSFPKHAAGVWHCDEYV